MSKGSLWLRAGCGLGGLLGLYLLFSGLVRLLDGEGPTGGPVARLVIGLVVVLVVVAVVVVARRELPRRARSGRDEGPRAAPGVEAVTCPRCGVTNAPSAQHCHTCEKPLR